MPTRKLGRFRIATTGGRSVGNVDFEGRPALFYGWASWHPSREELGKLETLHVKRGEDVAVASVAFDAEGPGRPMTYYAAARCSHLPLIDATFTLRRLWGRTSLPFWILVDADGCILAEGEALSIAAVEKALKGKPRHARGESASPKPRFEKPEFLLQTAGTYLSRSRIDDAAKCVAEAGTLDPECTFYRPQRLALLHPERFYRGPIDLTWLKSQP